MIRKRRWTVLTAFRVLFGVVLVGTLKQKPVYRAKALLEIEKENPSLVTPQELFQLDKVSDTYLETEYKVLRIAMSANSADAIRAKMKEIVPEYSNGVDDLPKTPAFWTRRK